MKYPAFISYSHSDEKVAVWLHRALERYRIPPQLVGQPSSLGPIPKRLFPIFRDRVELGSAAELGEQITKVLTESHCLIVLCSKQAVQSRWVNEEVRQFKHLGGTDRVLCLIVDGEPGDAKQECFPDAVRYKLNADGSVGCEPAEPLAADLRTGKDGRTDAKLKLIAGILGIGFDQLKQREVLARNRRLRLLTASSIFASVLLSGLTITAMQARNEARAQREIAQTRQGQAERLINFMLGDIRDRLEPIGKLAILDAVGEEAMRYFAEVPLSQLSDRELMARATALRQIGDVRVRQGKLSEASGPFREALALDQDFVRRHPNDEQAVFNVAQSQFYVGYDYFLRSAYDDALPWFENYLASAERLLELNPDKLDWQREKHYALDTLATIQTKRGEHDRCLQFAVAAEELAEGIVLRNSGDQQARLALTQTRGKLAECAWHLGDMSTKVKLQREILSERLKLFLEQPDNMEFKFQLAISHHALGTGLLELGDMKGAHSQITAALNIYDTLAQTDSSNALWLKFRFSALIVALEHHLLNGDSTAAATASERASQAWEELRGRNYPLDETALSGLQLANSQLAMSMNGMDTGTRTDVIASIKNGLSNIQLTQGPVRADLVIACILLDEADATRPDTCVDVDSKELDGASGRLDLVAQAMRDRRLGVDESAAADELRQRNIYDAQWHLFKLRCGCDSAIATN